MEMPPFTPRLSRISKDRYNISFLADGYPGKIVGEKVEPHPIYGIYVMRDYLYQFKKTKDDRYKQAVIRVAEAAIKRMEPFRDSLVFWYRMDSVFNSTSKAYYSALTQSYYAEVFAQVYEAIEEERFLQAAQQVYRSLKIPVQDGGVMHLSSKGPSIQEYPMSPNGYVLNGWFSAISAVATYARIVGDEDAERFWNDNLQTLIKMLPLYDAPLLANSRYALNGIATVKLRVQHTDIEFKQVDLYVPEEGLSSVHVAKKNLYENIMLTSSITLKGDSVFTKNRRATLSLLISRYSYPLENELRMKLFSPKESVLRLSLLAPQYAPKREIDKQSPIYHELKPIPLTKGINHISIKLPWKPLENVARATTFKQFGSDWHNVYHHIHLNRLKHFYELTNHPVLLHYYEKWSKAVVQWSEMPLYKGVKTAPYK
ncbi:D-glucuronyl C5-epimerase family protein [Shouchella patagoniensis]|uniref:D-glucuronyl C5-epimerase family protein n=1 Tax=Shouchella patagoniensis TaxID=228576 RepID=UPI0014742E22|nr:D-glucuronyl C5-epimerase family protein [Shouchella patagoniensis]